MASESLDAWAGFTIAGLGALVAYAAWNNVEGGATGILKDVITTGHIPSGLKGSSNPYGTYAQGKASTGPAPTSAAAGAVQFALAQRGKPYQWGATGPDAFDCSGLVQAAYKSVGIRLPRTTYFQINSGVAIPVASAPEVGDLVFPDVGHVMLAVGDGTCVQAPHTGAVIDVVPNPVKPIAIRRITKGG